MLLRKEKGKKKASVKQDEYKYLGNVPKGMEKQTLEYYEKMFLNSKHEKCYNHCEEW